MSRLVAQFDPTAGSGSFQAGATNRCSTLWVMNESPNFIALDFGGAGTVKIVQPWYNTKITLAQPASQVNWSVSLSLQSGSAPVSQVYVELFDPSEDVTSLISGPLFRQSNVGNAVAVTGASTVQNDGNVAGTVVVEATPSGAAGSQAKLTNDGEFLAGGGLFHISNAGIITAIPASAIPQTALAAGYPASSLGGGQVPAGVTIPAPQIGAGNLPAGVIVGAAATLASVIGALDNGTGQLHSTVNVRGIALGYLDGAGNYHQVFGVDGAGNVTTIAPPTLVAGIQETSGCGCQFTATAASQLFSVFVPFRCVMTNVPTSITLTPTSNVNQAASFPTAGFILKTGFLLTLRAAAVGTCNWWGTYTTVGN